jgi:DNA-binding response OmpR family regulator
MCQDRISSEEHIRSFFMTKVLVVAHDSQISRSLDLTLSFNGFTVQLANKVGEAWNYLKEIHFDIMLIDIALPDGNGIEFCEFLRESGLHLPVLFMGDNLEHLPQRAGDLGLKDYLLKPFGIQDLRMRMNRLMDQVSLPQQVILCGDLKIDLTRHVVTVKNKMISLGKRDLKVLIMLAKKTGGLVPKEKIFLALKDGGQVLDGAVYKQIKHLRKKLQDVAGNALQIIAVHGKGYRLEFQ